MSYSSQAAQPGGSSGSCARPATSVWPNFSPPMSRVTRHSTSCVLLSGFRTIQACVSVAPEVSRFTEVAVKQPLAPRATAARASAASGAGDSTRRPHTISFLSVAGGLR